MVTCPTCSRECTDDEPYCRRCQTPLKGQSDGKKVAARGINVRSMLIVAAVVCIGFAIAYQFWWSTLPDATAPLPSIAQQKPVIPPPAEPVIEPPKPKVNVRPAEPLPKFAEVPGKPFTWQAMSADGKVTLAQERKGKACSFTCTRGATTLWQASGACQGTVHDTHFIAMSCERTVTFFAKPEGKPKNLIAVYDRVALSWEVPWVALVEDEALRAKPHLIQGFEGNAGAPPVYAIDGEAVEFKTIDDKKQSLPLRAAAGGPN